MSGEYSGVVRYEKYNFLLCRSYVEDEIRQEEELRREKGYGWFRYYDLPVSVVEELGREPFAIDVMNMVLRLRGEGYGG